MTSPFCKAFVSYKGAPKHKLSNTVYLDSAATTQRLSAALDAMDNYHSSFNANVHRGGYKIAQQATESYEQSRNTMARFLGASTPDEIVFTSGATLSLNMIANGLTRDSLQGNKILLCVSEHHANLLPWQQLAAKYALEILPVYVDKQGRFTQYELAAVIASIDDSVALVAFAHVSNVLGNIYPVKKICQRAAQMNAISVIDGTQAAAHIPIDVKDIDCDFYVVSGHKMYASTGIGVLYGKYARLIDLAPSVYGGEMIAQVTLNSFTLQPPPLKFEAGTPNIAGAIGIAKAADFCMQHKTSIRQYENYLYDYLYQSLSTFDCLQFWGNKDESISLVSFTCKSVHAYDLANALSTHSIAVRAGQHCAIPLLHYLGIAGSVRVSLACYNTKDDIDQLIKALSISIDQLYANDQLDIIEPPAGALTPSLNPIEVKLMQAKSWNDKHRLLLLHSKLLPLLAPELRGQDKQINGCEANVWISADIHSKHFKGYSDSKIVRGLLSLLLNKANSLQGESISQFNFEDYFTSLGLTKYFSQGRKDGMQQVIKAISLLTSDASWG